MATFVTKAASRADAETAWALIARPARWREWAPHVRGATALGDPEVEAGRSGSVEVVGSIAVPATVLRVAPGRQWTWRVGQLEVDHRVRRRPSGCAVEIELRGPAALVFAYGPVVAALNRNLARVAARA